MQLDMALVTYATLTLINAYWTWQGRKVQNRDDVIKALRNQLELKEEAIQEMIKGKNEIKRQYTHLLAENKVLHGENSTYKKFHNHTQV